MNVCGCIFCCLLGDSSLQFPADEEMNETGRMESVLPSNTVMKDEKATHISKCGKLTVSSCAVM